MREESPDPTPSEIYSPERQTRLAAPGVQECNVLATSERPGLLETHFFSNVWFPFTLFSFLFFPECTAQGLQKGYGAKILPQGEGQRQSRTQIPLSGGLGTTSMWAEPPDTGWGDPQV